MPHRPQPQEITTTVTATVTAAAAAAITINLCPAKAVQKAGSSLMDESTLAIESMEELKE